MPIFLKKKSILSYHFTFSFVLIFNVNRFSFAGKMYIRHSLNYFNSKI